MIKQIRYCRMIAITLAIVSITLLTYNSVYASTFEPLPFNKIPSIIINSDNDEYEFTADYSMDFGGETQIEHDYDAELASNMKLVKGDDKLSLKVKCPSNDKCDDSLAPQAVSVNLVDRSTRDGHIVKKSVRF